MKSKYKRIYDLEEEGNKIRRIFTDGSSDLVEPSKVHSLVTYDIKPEHEPIIAFLERETTPIIDLKISSKIKISEFKEIEKYSEKIFFI